MNLGRDVPLTDESEEEDDNVGLMKSGGFYQRFDDFDGCPVKPHSLVGTSKLIIMASKKTLPELEVTAVKKSEDNWVESRDKYLAMKEYTLKNLHEECVQKLTNLSDRISAVQDLSETAVLHALRSPAGAVELFEQFQDNLRTIFTSVNRAIVAISVGRVRAPFLPTQDVAPEDCDQEEFKKYFASAKAHVKSIHEMIKCHAALLAKRIEQLKDDCAEDCPLDAEQHCGGATVVEQASTFYVRSTSEKIIKSVLFSMESLEAKLEVLQQCQARELNSECTVVMPKHRPLMPGLFQTMSNTSIFSPSQDNIDFLYTLERFMKPVFVQGGQTLIIAGTVGEGMFFVQSGNCQVSVDGKVLGNRRSGEFFGEIALMYATKRMADVRVTEDAELMMLPKKSFDEVLQAFPHVRNRIEGVGADRKRRLDAESAPQLTSSSAEEALNRVPSGSCMSAVWELEAVKGSSSTLSLLAVMRDLEASVRQRSVAPFEAVFSAGSKGAGLQVLSKGSADIHQAAHLHPCEPGTIFGLGPLFCAGEVGFDVMAGPEGAELLTVNEEVLFAYLKEQPAAVQLLKTALTAKVEVAGCDVWKFV